MDESPLKKKKLENFANIFMVDLTIFFIERLFFIYLFFFYIENLVYIFMIDFNFLSSKVILFFFVMEIDLVSEGGLSFTTMRRRIRRWDKGTGGRGGGGGGGGGCDRTRDRTKSRNKQWKHS